MDTNVVSSRSGIGDDQNIHDGWLDSVCTCKICNKDHSLAKDCVSNGCTCCDASNHSMVMDGIEGFPLGDGTKRITQ